ncbi:MAG: DegT/DnrJ/EryC1/StrS family aminotransferase [Deltaproteobacteria bacterium]|nr:MAG: DegT/DnrJ/EryC1/StrS family aminotransferase [Deltaproteobacteria bacterium]
MRIPVTDLKAETEPLRDELMAAVARVLDSGQFILGPEVDAFEAELAAAVGAAHAVGVSSGTDALLASLMALGVGPGDEVVTTPFTFFATAGAIARLGATPVFADIEPDTFNLDPDAAAAAITPRTRAVIAVNLFGRPADLPDAGGVPVVEDAAQSLGTGAPRGACATYSFFPAKVLGAFGDAGAVATGDADLADRVRLLRAHGARPKYVHAVVGGNFRIDAVQAALLRVKLPHLRDAIARRRQIAARYRAELPADVRPQADHPNHVYNYFVVRAPRRDDLRAALREAGIATAIYYPIPLHLQSCFADLGYRQGALPHAERAAGEVVALPCYPQLDEDRQARVIDAVRRFYGA